MEQRLQALFQLHLSDQRWYCLERCGLTVINFKLISQIYFLWGECQKNSLVIIQHWIRWWLGAIRQQAITWANVDLELWCHMASPGHSELMHTITYLLQSLSEITVHCGSDGRNIVSGGCDAQNMQQSADGKKMDHCPYRDGTMQDCSISCALVMEIL